MNEFKKLLLEKAKKGDFLSDSEKEAKMSVINEMKGMMKGMMGDDIRGLKKVTVASDSPEGLKEGLEKAEDVIESKMGEEESEEPKLSKEEKRAKLLAELEALDAE